MIKTADEAVYNYASASARAFLEGKKNLNWLLGMIRGSGVQGARLAEIFEIFRDYGNRQRFEEAVLACRQEGLLP